MKALQNRKLMKKGRGGTLREPDTHQTGIRLDFPDSLALRGRKSLKGGAM